MKRHAHDFVVCIKNDGYEVSLERRKIYLTIADEASEKLGLLRVIDESGEAYLYPRKFFAPIDLPVGLRRQVLEAA